MVLRQLIHLHLPTPTTAESVQNTRTARMHTVLRPEKHHRCCCDSYSTIFTLNHHNIYNIILTQTPFCTNMPNETIPHARGRRDGGCCSSTRTMGRDRGRREVRVDQARAVENQWKDALKRAVLLLVGAKRRRHCFWRDAGWCWNNRISVGSCST